MDAQGLLHSKLPGLRGQLLRSQQRHPMQRGVGLGRRVADCWCVSAAHRLRRMGWVLRDLGQNCTTPLVGHVRLQHFRQLAGGSTGHGGGDDNIRAMGKRGRRD